MQDAIYIGTVNHSRTTPRSYSFNVKVSMFWLNIRELSNHQSKSYGIYKYIDSNYLQPSSLQASNANLKLSDESCLWERANSLLQQLQAEIEITNIMLLTNLSFLGYCYNPVSFYYCYDCNDELKYLLAEVNNTPWNERYLYFVNLSNSQTAKLSYKNFHISPFMPKQTEYHWDIKPVSNNLNLKLEVAKLGKRFFSAALSLRKQQISTNKLWLNSLLYPFMSHKVILNIYWQALKFWLRGFKIYPKEDCNDR